MNAISRENVGLREASACLSHNMSGSGTMHSLMQSGLERGEWRVGHGDEVSKSAGDTAVRISWRRRVGGVEEETC